VSKLEVKIGTGTDLRWEMSPPTPSEKYFHDRGVDSGSS